MNQAFARFAYRLILRCHPTPFLARFGDEMQWIFEEESRLGGGARLLVDGVLSLLRQHLNVQKDPVQQPAGAVLLVSDFKLGKVRLFQGALIASLVFIGFVMMLKPRGGLLLIPFDARSQACIRCSIHSK